VLLLMLLAGRSGITRQRHSRIQWAVTDLLQLLQLSSSFTVNGCSNSSSGWCQRTLQLLLLLQVLVVLLVGCREITHLLHSRLQWAVTKLLLLLRLPTATACLNSLCCCCACR
jgi:uncharacterized protein involved in response to NO